MEKIYNTEEIKQLPKKVSLMPPSIVNTVDKRFAVFTGNNGNWINIDKTVTLDDLYTIWQRWEPTKSQEEKRLEIEKPRTWEILASNKKSFYKVQLYQGKFSCSCVGFGYYKKCKHIEEAKKSLNA